MILQVDKKRYVKVVYREKGNRLDRGGWELRWHEAGIIAANNTALPNDEPLGVKEMGTVRLG